MSADSIRLVVVIGFSLLVGGLAALLLDRDRRPGLALVVPCAVLAAGLMYAVVFLPGPRLTYRTWWHGLLLRVLWMQGSAVVTALVVFRQGFASDGHPRAHVYKSVGVVVLAAAFNVTAVLDLLRGPVTERGAIDFTVVTHRMASPRASTSVFGKLTVRRADGTVASHVVERWRGADRESLDRCAAVSSARVRLLVHVGWILDVWCE